MLFIVPKAHHAWTPDEEIVLRDLYLKGDSVATLALRFGVSENAIRRRLSHLGVMRGHSSRAAKEGHRTRARKRAEKDDIASRLRILLGEEVRPPGARRTFADDELLLFAGKGVSEAAARDIQARASPYLQPHDTPLEGAYGGTSWQSAVGFDTFCKEAAGIELMDHQLAMALICLASKRALCLLGRQSGKSHALAAIALWEAITQSNSSVIMVSAAQRQSDALMQKILGFVAHEEKLFDSVTRSSREELRFTNGSVIRALPASGLIRGYTATRVLLDEARDVLDEESTYSAIEPMLLVSNGYLSIATTPLGRQGRVWEAWNSPLYLKIQVPSSVSKYASEEHLERQRLEMTAALYQCEYEAVFMDVADSFFSAESVQRCAYDYDMIEFPEKGKRYSLGIDWARVRDASVMIVTSQDKDGLVRVEFIKAFHNVPLPTQVSYVKHLHRTFSFAKIVSEWAGLGIGPTDELVKDLGSYRVEAFKPTAERKALGYDALKRRMELGEIQIPMHPKLLTELRSLQFRVTEGGNMTIHAAADDYSDALFLSCWTFRPASFKPGIIEIPSSRPMRPRRETLTDLFPDDAHILAPSSRDVEASTCPTCKQPTSPPRLFSPALGAYFHPECWESRGD